MNPNATTVAVPPLQARQAEATRLEGQVAALEGEKRNLELSNRHFALNVISSQSGR